jgi:cell division topological specificity factor
MTLFERWFGKSEETSAERAKERLRLVLAHERAFTHFPFMDDLRKDIVEVIQKYMKVEDINIKTDQSRDLDLDMLEVEVSVGKDVKKEPTIIN